MPIFGLKRKNCPKCGGKRTMELVERDGTTSEGRVEFWKCKNRACGFVNKVTKVG